LTFNGPDGFAADVSSDLLLNISQPLLQRDIQFEGLTQSEQRCLCGARFCPVSKRVFQGFCVTVLQPDS
jgi:hypothetical protein